jgi:hypothetical protein
MKTPRTHTTTQLNISEISKKSATSVFKKQESTLSYILEIRLYKIDANTYAISDMSAGALSRDVPSL